MPEFSQTVREGQNMDATLSGGSTDPCGASCQACKGTWRCGESEADCQTPYALHRCPVCGPPSYTAPYWLHRGRVVVDRRTQQPSIIVNVRLGQTRQDSAVELLPSLDVSDTRPDYLRSLVMRVGVSDIEQHFESTPHKIAGENLP